MKPSIALFAALSAIFAIGCNGPKSAKSAEGAAGQVASCKSDEIVNAFGRCEYNGPGPAASAPTLSRTDFMTGLSNPWDMAFLPDGTMFFTERCRGLSVRKTDGTVTRLFGTTGSAVVAPDLFCEGQSGAHGIAIDPDFASNRMVYFYMASNINTNPRTNRVVRLVVAANFNTVSNRTDIVTDIPFKHVGNDVGGSGLHSGGRLRFGPDGYLYVTTGDNHNSALPQGLNNLGAKVLRLKRDGTAATGNNTPGGGDARIFTYGHRNVQGISFRPISGQPYTAEHGPGHTDEVTALVAGGNGGWDPRPETGVTCPSNYCGYTTNKLDGTLTPMTDKGKYPAAMPAVWNNGGASAGTGPGEFLKGRKWKSWHGRYAVGVMGAQRMDILELKSDGTLAGNLTASLPTARMRSIVVGPDENLYVATDSGSIWKVEPQ